MMDQDKQKKYVQRWISRLAELAQEMELETEIGRSMYLHNGYSEILTVEKQCKVRFQLRNYVAWLKALDKNDNELYNKKFNALESSEYIKIYIKRCLLVVKKSKLENVVKN